MKYLIWPTQTVIDCAVCVKIRGRRRIYIFIPYEINSIPTQLDLCYIYSPAHISHFTSNYFDVLWKFIFVTLLPFVHHFQNGSISIGIGQVERECFYMKYLFKFFSFQEITMIQLAFWLKSQNAKLWFEFCWN